MKRLFYTVALSAALGAVAAQAQNAPPASADPYANNANAGTMKFPLAAPAGKDSDAMHKALPGAVNTGSAGREDLEVRPGLQRTGRLPDLESGNGQDEGRRKSDWRHSFQRNRCRHLLRNGECRLRFHLDRNAALHA